MFFPCALAQAGPRYISIVVSILKMLALLLIVNHATCLSELVLSVKVPTFLAVLEHVQHVSAIDYRFQVIACVWFWIGDLHGGGGWIEAHQLNDAAWDYQHLQPAIVPYHL